MASLLKSAGSPALEKAFSVLLPKPNAKAAGSMSGRGILVCLIGLPGTGKSSLLSQFPNCEFIVDKRDQGILDLMDYSSTTGVRLNRSDVTVADSYLNYKGSLEAAIEGPKQTIICESMTGIQSLCDDHCLRTDYGYPGDVRANNRFVNYQEGYKIASNTYFQTLLDLMIKGQTKGKNMWLTGHSKVGQGKNITEDDWVSQVLNNDAAYCRRIDATFATILHIGTHVQIIAPKGKVRASGDVTFSLYPDFNPFFPAKNRMGLHNEIELPRSLPLAYKHLCAGLRLSPLTGIRLQYGNENSISSRSNGSTENSD